MAQHAYIRIGEERDKFIVNQCEILHVSKNEYLRRLIDEKMHGMGFYVMSGNKTAGETNE